MHPIVDQYQIHDPAFANRDFSMSPANQRISELVQSKTTSVTVVCNSINSCNSKGKHTDETQRTETRRGSRWRWSWKRPISQSMTGEPSENVQVACTAWKSRLLTGARWFWILKQKHFQHSLDSGATEQAAEFESNALKREQPEHGKGAACGLELTAGLAAWCGLGSFRNRTDWMQPFRVKPAPFCI